MNEKTAELRDIFVDVADEETVTESQREGHGSLVSESTVDERLLAVIGEMRERCGFATSHSDEELLQVVKGFYADEDDDAIAAAADATPEEVREARYDLHLLRDADTDASFDLAALRRALDESRPLADVADALDVEESTLRTSLPVVETQNEIRRVNDQYRTEFENVLSDRDIAERLTAGTDEDGLDEATEGQEIDLSF